MYSFIGKKVLKDHLGSSTDPFCIQNHVIMNRVIKRLRCTTFKVDETFPYKTTTFTMFTIYM